jgi:outer membrane protein TolC
MSSRTLHRLAAACVVALAAGRGLAADSTSADGALPPAHTVALALARSPTYQAALRGIDVESAMKSQLQAGPHEWVAGVSAARRHQASPGAESSGEWELGLDRTVRWPAKDAVYERAGSSRVALAQAARVKVWREQSRALLERYGAWLKDQQLARVWAEQSGLLEQQLSAVTRRRELGDASRIDEQLAAAAQLQARAQAQAAQRRSANAREALLQEFPGLEIPAPLAVTPAPADDKSDAHWLAAQLAVSSDLDLARREAAAAQAQFGVDRAELRPDPTVGLRVGQARSGGERFIGFALSLPFGGEHRGAVADVAAARAAVAAQRLIDAERRAQLDATLRLREAQATRALWRDQAEAAQRLDQVAQGLQRAYQLGEGSLNDLVAARRLAIEQQLSAAGSAVDAWMARQRLLLDVGALWPEPAVEP